MCDTRRRPARSWPRAGVSASPRLPYAESCPHGVVDGAGTTDDDPRGSCLGVVCPVSRLGGGGGRGWCPVAGVLAGRIVRLDHLVHLRTEQQDERAVIEI